MTKWIVGILFLIIVGTGVFNLGFTEAPLVDDGSAYSKDGKIRGVSWVGNDSVFNSSFQPLVKNNVEWMVQTPFGWQKSYNFPEVVLSTESNHLWGERDAGIIHTTHLAKNRGIKTILKPHIWLSGGDGKWRSDISMENEEDWAKWFSTYSIFIMHYAKLAEQLNIEVLCIGTELYLTTVSHDDAWRDIIKSIREVYSGKLTYAGNWYKEYNEITFWDELDYIGIQAYFPLVDIDHPDVATLKAGWQKHFIEIKALANKYNKPIVFTEVGYRAMPNAGIEPWLWPKRKGSQTEVISYQTQANCYQAMFETFWHEEWFGGVFIWKWFPDYSRIREWEHGFSPQNKPAEEVLGKWYGK